MAEKRYQVFVSSTFRDLEKERWEAVKALMTMDCIVAGMESFPAVDEEQFEYIKEIIDDCDYYLLILGGRYGSLAPDGVGYTEKEYDYARSRDIKVIALVREAPESLPSEKRETDAAQLDRFTKFREKVCADRLVSFWRDERDIQKDVALSMNKAMKKFPAVGWVRADTAASEELLQKNFKLKKRVDAVEKELENYRTAFFDEKILDKLLKYSVYCKYNNELFHNSEIPYGILMEEMFSLILRLHKRELVDDMIKKYLLSFAIIDKNRPSLYIKDEVIEYFIKQMQLYEVISFGYPGNETIYILTPLGKKLAKQMLLTP